MASISLASTMSGTEACVSGVSLLVVAGSAALASVTGAILPVAAVAAAAAAAAAPRRGMWAARILRATLVVEHGKHAHSAAGRCVKPAETVYTALTHGHTSSPGRLTSVIVLDGACQHTLCT